MPATRSSRQKSKARVEPSSRSVLPLDDDVIIISSDEEDVSSAAYALKKSQQKVRSLEKKILALEASNKQVLSDQGNHPSQPSSARPNKHAGDERQSLEIRHQQATAEIKKLESALRLEKKARTKDVARATIELQSVAAVNQELHTEVKLLREELHVKSGTKANNTLEDLENHILCEVCVEKLWNPFMLSGCGHTFCQGCLTDWFNTNVAASPQNPQYSCPTCRTRVLQRPIEDFALKNVVRAISHAIDPSHGSPAVQSRNHSGHGPWSRFFRS